MTFLLFVAVISPILAIVEGALNARWMVKDLELKGLAFRIRDHKLHADSPSKGGFFIGNTNEL